MHKLFHCLFITDTPDIDPSSRHGAASSRLYKKNTRSYSVAPWESAQWEVGTGRFRRILKNGKKRYCVSCCLLTALYPSSTITVWNERIPHGISQSPCRPCIIGTLKCCQQHSAEPHNRQHTIVMLFWGDRMWNKSTRLYGGAIQIQLTRPVAFQITT